MLVAIPVAMSCHELEELTKTTTAPDHTEHTGKYQMVPIKAALNPRLCLLLMSALSGRRLYGPLLDALSKWPSTFTQLPAVKTTQLPAISKFEAGVLRVIYERYNEIDMAVKTSSNVPALRLK